MALAPDIASIIVAKAQQYGQDPAYMLRQAQIESSGNPNARNPSGASGLFQFMPKTAAAYGLSNPFDAESSSDAAARLARDNGAYLSKSLGRDPTSGELYLAHQQGMSGATKLLTNPDALAADLVGVKAVVGNGGSPGDTAAQFAGRWTGKFDGSGPAVTMPGAASARGAFGLTGPTASGMPNSVTPAGGAQMETPERETGPDLATLMRLLMPAQEQSASAPAAQPAPVALVPPPAPQRRQVAAFDPSRFYALLHGARS